MTTTASSSLPLLPAAHCAVIESMRESVYDLHGDADHPLLERIVAHQPPGAVCTTYEYTLKAYGYRLPICRDDFHSLHDAAKRLGVTVADIRYAMRKQAPATTAVGAFSVRLVFARGIKRHSSPPPQRQQQRNDTPGAEQDNDDGAAAAAATGDESDEHDRPTVRRVRIVEPTVVVNGAADDDASTPSLWSKIGASLKTYVL